MQPKPIVGGKVFQGLNLVPEIPHGFSQKQAFRPHLPGDFVRITTNELTPPTVAPVLSSYVEFESYIVNLTWTPSNKAGSPGFGYKIQYRYSGGGWTTSDTVTGLSYAFNPSGSPIPDGLYEFQVIPFNDAGEGVGSNITGENLPGESSNQYRLIEDGADRLLEDGSKLLLG